MHLSFADFWKLAVESRLLAPKQCQQLHQDFSQIKGAVESGSTKTLVEWLVSRNVISPYQARILSAGLAGPFVYGDYRVYDRVDGGRLGGWFRAVHGPTSHPVLLEFLTGAVTTDPQLWATAAHEAAESAKIVSPHLQRRFEVVDLTTFKFVVGEDLRGATAEERMAQGRIPPQEACRIIFGAALGLAQLHQAGKIHGDVRPANLFLESIPNHPGHVKLLRDAVYIPQPLQLGQPDTNARWGAKGDYLAPEHIQAGKLPDPLTDLYALGCTFYCLLAGSPPFAGGTLEQKLSRHATEAIRPLEQLGVPQPIAQLVAYLMAKNPTVRYQQANVVAEQLAAFIDPQVLYLQPPPPPPSLPAYEAWIQQKQAALAAKPAAAPVGMAVAPGGLPTGQAVSVAPAGVGLVSEKPIAVGPNFAALGGAKSDASGPAIKSTDAKTSVADLKARSEKEKTKQVVYALAGVGGLAIVALIAIQMSGGGNKKPTEPGDNTVVENPIAPPTDDPTKPPAVTPPGVTPEKPNVPTTNVATNTPQTTPPKEVTEVVGPSSPTPEVKPEKPPTGDVQFTQSVVPDDGNLLWASPTEGKPLTLRGVPPEGQLFLVLRPAALVKSAEGKRVLEALEPDLGASLKEFEAASGLILAAIDRLVITFHNNDGKYPRVSFVVHPATAMSNEELTGLWGDPEPRKEKDGTFYHEKGWAYSIPPAVDNDTIFVMSKDAETIKDGLSQKGAPPVLRKEVERLRRMTDVDRHFTALFYPNFFFNNDGEPLFEGALARTRKPLEWMMGDDLLAGCASMHFGEPFYYEVRLISNLGKDKLQLAKEFRERLEAVPKQMRSYLAAMNPPEYWKQLAFMVPGMITQTHSHMRIGVEDESAVVNGVLPGIAAHNLVLGLELTALTAPGAGGGTSVAVKPAGPAMKTIQDVLNSKVNMFSFDSMSLEFAMQDIAKEGREIAKPAGLEFEVKVIGDDLKLDGITRNMSVNNFKQEGKTLGEILTALVMKANPITTVKDPSEADQKLLWVVGPNPDDPNKQIVLITTRQMAEKKKYTLPAAFQKK